MSKKSSQTLMKRLKTKQNGNTSRTKGKKNPQSILERNGSKVNFNPEFKVNLRLQIQKENSKIIEKKTSWPPQVEKLETLT